MNENLTFIREKLNNWDKKRKYDLQESLNSDGQQFLQCILYNKMNNHLSTRP